MHKSLQVLSGCNSGLGSNVTGQWGVVCTVADECVWSSTNGYWGLIRSRSGKVSSVMERVCNELNDVPATQNEAQFNTEIQLAAWRKESKPFSARLNLPVFFGEAVA
jgi:hypothetical protein